MQKWIRERISEVTVVFHLHLLEAKYSVRFQYKSNSFVIMTLYRLQRLKITKRWRKMVVNGWVSNYL